MHRATNAALDISGWELGAALDYEWVGTDALLQDESRLGRFDGIWAAPGGPYRSLDGALWAIRYARERGLPFIGT